VQGAVIWYGVLDMTHLHRGAGRATVQARYLGCDAPPVLLVLGKDEQATRKASLPALAATFAFVARVAPSRS
jgi:hypothetical protein